MNAQDPKSTSPKAGARLTRREAELAVEAAHIPALVLMNYQFTGDERWLCEPFLPTRARGLTSHDDGGLSEAAQVEVRATAVDVILAMQDGAKPKVAHPGPEQARHLMSVFLGEEVAAEYGGILASELAHRSSTGADRIEAPPVDAPEGFRVVVIGAGIAGIVAAHFLEEMGVDYAIYEKQPAAGGNWWQNTYPGCGVDTPSHLYSFSFAENDWSMHFALRDELQAYFDDVMAQAAGPGRVHYNTEVTLAEYDEVANLWRLTIRGSDGQVCTETASIVISAVGVLNIPKLPDLPGIESFGGVQFHSSDWPDDLELAGKRVAIVGTGASSMQISPEIAPIVEHLSIVQRSPQWVAPFPQFRQKMKEDIRPLLRSNRLYSAWFWMRHFWNFGDKVIEDLRVDPDWQHPDRSVNARNDGHRELFTRYALEQVGDRPDLVEKVIPDYPPFGKRILLDNNWFKTLLRDNVDLVADGVASVDATGLTTTDGTRVDAEVIIWATGFQAARFLSSFDVRGMGAASLREVWEDDNPKAFLGISVPGFPNFLMLGGPNSFPGSGSFMFFMEVQMRYIRELITLMFSNGVDAVDAKPERTEEYNRAVDELHERTVWTHPGMSTYYRNSRGRVVFIMPFTNREYWEMTAKVDLDDYTLRKVPELALAENAQRRR